MNNKQKSVFGLYSVEVSETFEFASHVEVLQAVKLDVGSHYGSMLCDLGSDMARQ